jgi:hypothetical protein
MKDHECQICFEPDPCDCCGVEISCGGCSFCQEAIDEQESLHEMYAEEEMDYLLGDSD